MFYIKVIDILDIIKYKQILIYYSSQHASTWQRTGRCPVGLYNNNNNVL